MSKTMKAIELGKLESERAAIRNRKDEKPFEVAAYFFMSNLYQKEKLIEYQKLQIIHFSKK